MRRWVKSRNEMGAIFGDNTTAFAYIDALINSKDTEQCRNNLKLAPNVDMAVISTVISVNTFTKNGNTVTIWMCSDLRDTSFKVVIYGDMPKELESVSQSSVVAVLNPDLTGYSKDNLRSISIKQCDNVLLIGEVDGVQICRGVTTNGTRCKNVVYKHHHGDFCKYHLKSAFATSKTATMPNKPKTEDIMKHVHGTIEEHKMQVVTNNITLKPSEPTDPKKIMSKLGGLGSLLNRVAESRTKNIQVLQTNQPVKVTVTDRSRDFENAVANLKNIIQPDHKNNKRVLGLLQLIAKYINHVDKECIKRTGIFKMCISLLDHPVEVIAIESLKLRRAIKRFMQTPEKDNSTPTFVVGQKREETRKTIANKSTAKDLETIISATSDVDAYVHKENIETTKRKLEALERMDKANEFKRTVTEIEIVASYCHDCNAWTEKPNPVCKEERHRCSAKKCKMAYHMNGNVKAFNEAMRACIANKEFDGISPDEAADKFVTLLEENGIRYIASDFDATMIAEHSGGYCEIQADRDVLSSVTEHFKAVARRLKKSSIDLVIVTFSDDWHFKNHPSYISGPRMVNKALEFSNCDADIKKVYDFYPSLWKNPTQYKILGLKAPMPMHKEYHLRSICSDFNVNLNEIILIDDDLDNCTNAKKIGAAVLHVTKQGFNLSEVALI
ncbi:uncharacterized protein BXIN_2368 [Babesia sp. Xinjiang]|uniref:uncharacterized protein n=1 Tax=Babesia sp. Xinjiang TaxID=462227 RepID=UPI000A22D095|nr:uncharacterized protein BXIN_2368 [Babesia sp. Xinjiang]ORM40729.1 hypothetical protein BXIN_2368 [Babesia sp. Xinjiang]